MKLFEKILDKLGLGPESNSILVPEIIDANSSLPSYWDISKFVDTILYHKSEPIGLVVRLLYERLVTPDSVELRIDTSIKNANKIIIGSYWGEEWRREIRIYQMSELEENWIVDEIPVLGSFRYFRIRVNPKDF